MEIVDIFAEKLYAVKHAYDTIDVYNKCIESWTDVEYVREFVKKHQSDIKGKDINKVVENIIEDAEDIDQLLYELSLSTNENIDEFFAPLLNSEYKVQLLSRQKGRIHRKSYTRIYGIKIESNCFVITGGAIKFTLFMDEREHTKQELKNIDKVRDYLKDNQVIDKYTFQDLDLK
jgi:hypothetical protein